MIITFNKFPLEVRELLLNVYIVISLNNIYTKMKENKTKELMLEEARLELEHMPTREKELKDRINFLDKESPKEFLELYYRCPICNSDFIEENLAIQCYSICGEAEIKSKYGKIQWIEKYLVKGKVVHEEISE